MTTRKPTIGKLSNHAVRFIRDSAPPLKLAIQEAIEAIRTAPELGKTLNGDLHGVRVTRVTIRRQQYRIAYTEGPDTYILLIGPRENFYRKLRRICK